MWVFAIVNLVSTEVYTHRSFEINCIIEIWVFWISIYLRILSVSNSWKIFHSNSFDPINIPTPLRNVNKYVGVMYLLHKCT